MEFRLKGFQTWRGAGGPLETLGWKQGGGPTGGRGEFGLRGGPGTALRKAFIPRQPRAALLSWAWVLRARTQNPLDRLGRGRQELGVEQRSSSRLSSSSEPPGLRVEPGTPPDALHCSQTLRSRPRTWASVGVLRCRAWASRPQGHLQWPEPQNPSSCFVFVGGGVPLLVHRLPGTLSASCHRRRVLFLQLGGAHAAGMGRVTPAQGRAGLPPGLKDKPTDQTPCPPALKVLLPQGGGQSGPAPGF